MQHISELHSFSLPSNAPLSGCVPHFIHSLVGEHWAVSTFWLLRIFCKEHSCTSFYVDLCFHFHTPREGLLAWLGGMLTWIECGPRARPRISAAAPTFSLSLLCKQRLMEQFPEMVCRCPLFWKAWGWRGGGRGGFGCLRAVLTSPIYPMAAPESPSSILPEVKRENGTARGQTVMGCIYEQPGYLAPLPRS